MPLSDSDRAILDAWSLSWTFPALRDQRIADETGLSPHRATLRLNQLLETREALEYAPATVHRLRAFRARRQRTRSARRVG